jgi:signal peptidase I
MTDVPEAIPMGLILMRSRKNGNINVISLTINQFYADSHMPKMNYGDLEYMKVFLFINQLKKQLFPGLGKLGQIILFNPITDENVSYYRNPITKYKEFRQLIYDQKLENSLILEESNILGIQDIALYNIDSAFRSFEGSEEDVKKMTDIFSKMQDTNLNELDAKILEETLEAFNEAFPSYQARLFESKINFSDNKEVLYVLLHTALISKRQLQESLVGDVSKISKFSMGFSDFGSLIKGLYTNKQNTYDKSGNKI